MDYSTTPIMPYPLTNIDIFSTPSLFNVLKTPCPPFVSVCVCVWCVCVCVCLCVCVQTMMIYGYFDLRMFPCGQNYASLCLNPAIQENTKITPKHEFKKLPCGLQL